MRPGKTAAVAALCLGAISTLIAAGPATARDDAEAMNQLLFSGDPAPAAKHVHRWTGTVYWSVTAKRGEVPLLDLVSAIVEINSTLFDCGVLLAPATPEHPPDIFVSFLPRTAIRSLKGSASHADPGRVGYTIAFPGPKGSLSFASVAIADDLVPRHRKYVIRHELLHALGIPKHTTREPDSVMHRAQWPDDAPTSLFPFDRELLRFLYADLKPGETRTEADRIWRRTDR